jgi:hypothetical protein
MWQITTSPPSSSLPPVGGGTEVGLAGTGCCVAGGGVVLLGCAGLSSLFDFGLLGVSRMGAAGPLCKSSQGSKATGNCRQFELSEQTFKLKEVDWGPRQSSMRLPFTTLAVRQVTGEELFTLK